MSFVPASLGVAAEPAATFQVLFDNQNIDPRTVPMGTIVGASADGSVLTGNSSYFMGLLEVRSWPFRYTNDTLEALGAPANLPPPPYPGAVFQSPATGISGDGLVIVGYIPVLGRIWPADDSADVTTQGGAFRWTAETGAQFLFDPPDRGSVPTAVSTDGSVIVGYSQKWTAASNPEPGYIPFFRPSPSAFRWTATGILKLPALPGDTQTSATGVSGDGSVTVGYSVTGTQNLEAAQACQWTADGSVTGLGYLPADDSIVTHLAVRSEARAISADGSVVIGTSTTTYPVNNYVGTTRTRGFRWTVEGGMQDIGDILGGIEPSVLSADGSVIAGDDNGSVAFRWDVQHGWQNLRALLMAAGVDLRGLRLTSVVAVSADGKTFFGRGVRDYQIDDVGGSFGVSATSFTGLQGDFYWKATLPVVPELPSPTSDEDSSALVSATEATTPAPSINRKINTTPLSGDPNRVVVRGTATAGVSKITYRVGNAGTFKQASGNTSWRFTAQLKPGRNVITVIAYGPDGSATRKKIVVFGAS